MLRSASVPFHCDRSGEAGTSVHGVCERQLVADDHLDGVGNRNPDIELHGNARRIRDAALTARCSREHFAHLQQCVETEPYLTRASERHGSRIIECFTAGFGERLSAVREPENGTRKRMK